MNKDEYEIDEWRKLVGTAILSFGDIEFATIKCLAHLPSDNIFKTTSRLPFSRRVDLIIEILEARKNQVEENKELINKLKRAKELAEWRNVLAHNPLITSIYEHKADGDLVVQKLIKAERKNSKEIDLSTLKELAAEIDNLSSEIYLALSKCVGLIDEILP